MKDSHKKILKLVIGVFVLASIIGLVYHFELTQYLAEENREKLKAWILSFGILAPLLFFLVYVLATVFFVSALALTILSGIIFGKLWGSIIVVGAATIAALICFFLAKYFGADFAKRLEGNGGVIGKMVKKIDTEVDKNGFRAFFVLRCLFLPYTPLSYAAGLCPKAKWTDFGFATLLTNAVFSPVFVFLGAQIFEGPKALILPVVLIALVFSVPKIVKKIRGEK